MHELKYFCSSRINFRFFKQEIRVTVENLELFDDALFGTLLSKLSWVARASERPAWRILHHRRPGAFFGLFKQTHPEEFIKQNEIIKNYNLVLDISDFWRRTKFWSRWQSGLSKKVIFKLILSNEKYNIFKRQFLSE